MERAKRTKFGTCQRWNQGQDGQLITSASCRIVWNQWESFKRLLQIAFFRFACGEDTDSMNSMKLVNSLHSLYWSIHTKDESKRGTAFAFIFGVN